jgi:transcriptional regulator with XRE-family HTH domain
MEPDGRPLLGPLQPQLGLSDQIIFEVMNDSRNNKSKRGRISHSTRGIFYENLEKGLNWKVSGGIDADKIRFLMKFAFVSRTHAQRLVKGMRSDVVQAPSIDTLAFIADAFGVTASQFLTQGCRFATESAKNVADSSSGMEELQQSSGRNATRRRFT